MEIKQLGEDITLVLGDCLEYMKTMEAGSVDLLITSPPYNIIGNFSPSGMLKNNPRNISRDWYMDNIPESDYQDFIIQIVEIGLQITKGLVWINHKVRYRNLKAIHPMSFLDFPLYSEVIWDRCGSFMLNANKFANSHEYILGFGKPQYWNSETNKLMSVWRIPPSIDPEHPCSFPLEIPSRLIQASSIVNSIVFDPFMGSGTTGVAAVQLGRKFIGCEIEPKYFEIAEKRIRQAQMQLRLGI